MYTLAGSPRPPARTVTLGKAWGDPAATPAGGDERLIAQEQLPALPLEPALTPCPPGAQLGSACSQGENRTREQQGSGSTRSPPLLTIAGGTTARETGGKVWVSSGGERTGTEWGREGMSDEWGGEGRAWALSGGGEGQGHRLGGREAMGAE
ncbi:hypothetical protein KIL84_002274 [Mauremys mutica]|uniref:Uncharacterized protein n=1 Tax=Mauremys mutica TaxID=74926 RepID=A0A9D3X7I9_9SAUR|nr:hypothetical protein KIL84_002274 [Mauremys mutica]